uniref:TMC domain-containing protein n=1 Tax=Meloidogyne incognita TaxID=6306 RepID=A0A914KR16_MELIC
MWQRFRQYLPFSILVGQKAEDKNKKIENEEEEDDERREETSFDATPGLLSDEDEESGAANFSSTRSSFRRNEPKTHHRTASNVSGQQPPKGKFFKRSETAPRSSTSGGGGSFGSVGVSKAAKKQQQKRPFSATPRSEGGDAPNSAAENLTSRLSRRSSIISDLVALMVRRSSSMGHRGSGQQKGRGDGGGGSSSGGGGDQREELSSQDQKERSVDSREEERRLRRNDYNGEDEEEEDIGNMPREKILQRIRHHKEIIGKVRLQPWPMRRKRRALKVARQYLQKQEAQVSKWHLYKVEASRRGNQAWRWAKNLSIYLIPWESKIKQIESNFGSVVSSFFIFLRWVLGMNVANSLLVMAFVVVPEWLADSKNDIGRFNRTRHIKAMPTKVAVHADELNTVLDFGGYLQYSYLFYGYYSHETVLKGFIIGYHVPVAYVFLNLFLLVFCIFIILKKMTSNTRKSKLSSGKQEQYVFTWKAINGWDYNIGEPETAASLAMANAIKLKVNSLMVNYS